MSVDTTVATATAATAANGNGTRYGVVITPEGLIDKVPEAKLTKESGTVLARQLVDTRANFLIQLLRQYVGSGPVHIYPRLTPLLITPPGMKQEVLFRGTGYRLCLITIFPGDEDLVIDLEEGEEPVQVVCRCDYRENRYRVTFAAV